MEAKLPTQLGSAAVGCGALGCGRVAWLGSHRIWRSAAGQGSAATHESQQYPRRRVSDGLSVSDASFVQRRRQRRADRRPSEGLGGQGQLRDRRMSRRARVRAHRHWRRWLAQLPGALPADAIGGALAIATSPTSPSQHSTIALSPSTLSPPLSASLLRKRIRPSTRRFRVRADGLSRLVASERPLATASEVRRHRCFTLDASLSLVHLDE